MWPVRPYCHRGVENYKDMDAWRYSRVLPGLIQKGWLRQRLSAADAHGAFWVGHRNGLRAEESPLMQPARVVPSRRVSYVPREQWKNAAFPD